LKAGPTAGRILAFSLPVLLLGFYNVPQQWHVYGHDVFQVEGISRLLMFQKVAAKLTRNHRGSVLVDTAELQLQGTNNLLDATRGFPGLMAP
jgi:hypothetical protein